MSRTKNFIMVLFISLIMFLMPNISKATVEVTRNVYSNTGSMKFTFTGLELDTTHEYEFGITETSSAEVEEWYVLTNYTKTSADVNISITTKGMRDVFNATDTGYITIKDKETDAIIMQPYAVDLKMPYLQVTNYNVIENGKELTPFKGIQIAFRNASVSEPYYQYEKITDQKVIDKYKEIKASNGNMLELETLLKTDIPTTNWNRWEYWTGYGSDGLDGQGYTESKITVPDQGLYYMWLYFSGSDIKDVYGCILVDNLGNEVPSDNNNQDNTSNQNNVGNQNLTNTVMPDTQDKISGSDSTAANKFLPKAGKSIIIIILTILSITIAMILYIKNKKYKDIK